MTNFFIINSPSSDQFLSLLIDSNTYPNKKNDENRIRLITFILCNTDLLNVMKNVIMQSPNNVAMETILYQITTFLPPYYYSTPLLIEKYQRNRSNSNYLTRPTLLRMITTELLTEPFLLDNISPPLVTELVVQLPLKEVLDTISNLFTDSSYKLNDMIVAGLLMNITQMGDIDSGKYLSDILVSCSYLFL